MKCDGCRKEITSRIWSVVDGSNEYCDENCYQANKPYVPPTNVWLAPKPENFIYGVFGENLSY